MQNPFTQRNTHIVSTTSLGLADIDIKTFLKTIQTYLTTLLVDVTGNVNKFETLAMYPVSSSGVPDIALPAFLFEFYGADVAPPGQRQGTNQLNVTLKFEGLILVGSIWKKKANPRPPRPDVLLRELAVNAMVALHKGRRFATEGVQPARIIDSMALPDFQDSTGNYLAWTLEWEHDVLLDDGDIIVDPTAKTPTDIFLVSDITMFFESAIGGGNRGSDITFTRNEPEFAFGTDRVTDKHYLVFSPDIEQFQAAALATLRAGDRLSFVNLQGQSLATVTIEAPDWDATTRTIPLAEDTLPTGALTDTASYRLKLVRNSKTPIGTGTANPGEIIITEKIEV